MASAAASWREWRMAGSTDLKAGVSVDLGTIELGFPLVEAYRGTDLAALSPQ